MSKVPENCPNCGKKMEEGCIFAYSTKKGCICFSKEEPYGYWYPMPRGSEILMTTSYAHREKRHWVRKGFRCRDCKIVLFSYGKEE